MFSPSKRIDLTSLVYVQAPPCGYAYTSSLTWTGLTTFITTPSNFILDVFSQDTTVGGTTSAAPSQTYTMTLANDITIASNGPAGSSTFAASGATITFTITITNPCWTTTIPQINTFNPATAMTVVNGASVVQEYTRPVNGVETSTKRALICGAYAFEVYQDTSDTALSVNWIKIAEKSGSPGQYLFTADTSVSLTLLTNVSPRSYTVQIKAYLVDYPVVKTYTTKTVEITGATCDCSKLAWDAPTVPTPTFAVAATGTPTLVLPVANKGAQATSFGFDACYKLGSGCAETGRFQAGSIKYDDKVTTGGVALPSWITFSSTGTSTQTITIAPTSGTLNGQHTLFATFTPTNGPEKTYTVMKFTVTCTITDYSLPSAPSESGTPAF